MELRLQASVGPSGSNDAGDVRLVRALLNVCRRQAGDPVLPMWATADPELFAAIARFQVQQGAPVASSTVAPRSSTWQGLLDGLRATRTLQAVVPPVKGRLTWELEGGEGGGGHSRVLRVPRADSGLVLGRGYEMSRRSRVGIQRDLVQAGVEASLASRIGGAATLVGNAAREFVISSDLLDFELDPGSQLRLFDGLRDALEGALARLCARPDLVAAYGQVDWNRLDPRIRDCLIDLHFRGDYTDQTLPLVQPSIVGNDLAGYRRVLSDRRLWSRVPADRFERRRRYLA